MLIEKNNKFLRRRGPVFRR